MKKPSEEEQIKITEGVMAGLSACFGGAVSEATKETTTKLLTGAFFSNNPNIHFTVRNGVPKANL